MIYVLFASMALLTVFVAVKLSRYADIISQKTAFGGMFIGSFLLATATSLPELTTSATSIMIANPDLAIGNLLGSNLFNMLIIASLDIYFRRQHIFRAATGQLRFYAMLSIGLTVIVLSGLFFRSQTTVFGMGVDTLLLLMFYGAGLVWITRRKSRDAASLGAARRSGAEQATAPLMRKQDGISVRQAVYRFAIAALVILVTGSVLTITGDRIAEITNIGSSFIGAFLIAASTSLPEAASVYVVILLANYRLAIGSVLSSNLFNLVLLSGTDLFYRRGPILTHAAETHQMTAISGILLTGIVLYALTRRQRHGWMYVVPSAAVVIIYFLFTYMIFYAS